MVKNIKYRPKLSNCSIDRSINTHFEQIFWFWPPRRTWRKQRCAEREVGQATGLSVLPRGQSWPLKTVCVFSSPPPGCCLPQHKTVTLRLFLSSPPSLAFLFHCDKHSLPCSVWETPTINMCHMSLTSQEDLSLQELGGSINHATPYSSPRVSPTSLVPPSFPPSCFLNIELPG